MQTLDPAWLKLLTIHLAKVDAAHQARQDACSVVKAARFRGCTPARMDVLNRGVCGAGADCESAQEDLVEAVRVVLSSHEVEGGIPQ